jgi:hypothetical protein
MKSTSSRRYIFILLGIFYILYLLFFQLARGLDGFFKISHWWEIFLHVSLIIVPIYIIVLWQARDRMTPLDYHTLYIPFVFWIILVALTGGKSGTTFYIVELPIVVMSLGLYLLKFPLLSFFKMKNSIPISVVLWVVICLLIIGTHYLFPVFPD